MPTFLSRSRVKYTVLYLSLKGLLLQLLRNMFTSLVILITEVLCCNCVYVRAQKRKSLSQKRQKAKALFAYTKDSRNITHFLSRKESTCNIKQSKQQFCSVNHVLELQTWVAGLQEVQWHVRSEFPSSVSACSIERSLLYKL